MFRGCIIASLSCALASCGGSGSAQRPLGNDAAAGRLAPAPKSNWTTSTALRDATHERGAYYVPAAVVSGATLVGTEPDGTRQLTIEGLRTSVDPNGTIRAAPNRFSQASKVFKLGTHLGGGFLFVVGPAVWKAASWLAEAKPLWVSSTDVQTLYEGLDRVYARSNAGNISAFDAQTGSALDLGGWPRTPTVTSMLALDRFRAVALADLRGVLFTEDAGKTWSTQVPTFDAQSLSRSTDGVIITGLESTAPPRPVRYIVGPQGFLSQLPGEAATQGSPSGTAPSAVPSGTAGAKKDAPQASRTAHLVAEGWPLGDGTFLHAGDGDLVRYDMATLRERGRANNAFEERRAICQGIALPTKTDATAFGYVCSESEGVTTIYAYANGGLQKRARFRTPREVHASATGSVTVRGSCDDTKFKRATAGAGASTFCIVNELGQTREVDLRGSVDQARLVALADGRVVVLSPPHGVLGHARISLLENGAAKTIPLQFAPNLPAKTASLLEHGLWLDAWEERDAGVIGGWVEAGGTLIGVEVATLTGRTSAGALLSDPIAYSTSGRFAFGWTNGRRGFESVDGGMHWEQVTVPDRDSGATSSLRGCSPVGCVGRGWIRVGWGEAKETPLPAPQTLAGKPRTTRPQGLSLSCEVEKRVAAPKDADDEEPRARAAILGPRVHGSIGARGSFTMSAQPPATASAPFWSGAGPTVPKDSAVVSGDSFDLFGAGRNVGLVGRAYAWGPKGIDWDRGVSWNVYWLSPFDASNHTMHAKATTTPTAVLDWLRPFTVRGGPSANWQFAIDDPEHALMGVRAYGSGYFTTTLFTLEAGHAPAQVARTDGEPFGQISSAVRVGARWVVLQSTPPSAERPSVSLFVIEGTSARFIAKLPRLAGAGSTSSFRLATSASDRIVGLVVDPAASASERWVIPIKIDSGEVFEPEALGLIDLTDRISVPGCERGASSTGYRFDAPINGSVNLGDAGSIYNVIARVHVSSKSACIEAVSGNYNQTPADLFRVGASRGAKGPLASEPSDKGQAFPISVAVAGTRQLLRCKTTR